MSDKRNGEQGATAVFIAAALLVLMALVSLAVDGGLGFNERRGTQNAADLAALAAAWEDCNPQTSTSTPELAARDVADQNGYLHNAGGYPTVDVASPGSGVWTVTITERNETTFGRATPNAPDQITVVSQATARCVEAGLLDGYAVFGQSSRLYGMDVDVDLSGSSLNVNGGVHSERGSARSRLLAGPSVSGDVSLAWQLPIWPGRFPEWSTSGAPFRIRARWTHSQSPTLLLVAHARRGRIELSCCPSTYGHLGHHRNPRAIAVAPARRQSRSARRGSTTRLATSS